MEDSSLPTSSFQLPNSKQPLIAIVGQTASGKSALAMRLAQKYEGEIIAADSRTVYKNMDIGTAKPSSEEQTKVPHYCLDLVEPNEQFTAADFKREALKSINMISKKGRVPFLVGGTGLYVDAVLYDFEFGDKPDLKLRSKLEAMSLNDLQEEARKLGISEKDISFVNPRHLSRAIERGGMIKKRKPLPKCILILGLKIDPERLNERIIKRVDKMLAEGLVEEVKGLINRYGSEAPGVMAPAYNEVKEYLNSSKNIDEVREGIISSHRYLAKRQMTWFKRNPDIVWVQTFEEADKLVGVFLSKFGTIHS